MKMNNVLFRRIMAWVMLGMFLLLIFNILIFHVFLVETGILYAALVAVFFLGGGINRNNANNFEEHIDKENEENLVVENGKNLADEDIENLVDNVEASGQDLEGLSKKDR